MKKIKISKKDLIAAVLAAALFWVFCWSNNKCIVTSEYTIHTDKLTGGGVNIVQISDLHSEVFGAHNRRLMKKIKALRPDVILITGDIVSTPLPDVDKALEFCENATKIAPCYYVDGNHEVALDDDKHDELYSGMEKAGVNIIDNKTDTIEINGSRIQLMGLEDEHLDDDTQTSLAAELDDDLPTVLLAHEPQYFEDYCRTQPTLVLSGHVHGGQFRFFGKGVLSPEVKFFPKYDAGAFVSGSTTMIISRGLGKSLIPLRLFNQPEVVCVHLER